MTIATIDQFLAGCQQPYAWYVNTQADLNEGAATWHSLIYHRGQPCGAVAPSSGMAGAALTSYAGCLQYDNPVSGNSYLARLTFNGGGTNTFVALFLDRLWHNSGIAVTTTTAQTINSVAWPARDRNGSTDGEGVMVALEVSTATTNGAAVTNCTMSYTNSAGVSGRTATVLIPATAAKGTFCIFRLQSGDYGVQSIQSITLGTSLGGGAVHLVAFRTLAVTGMANAGQSAGLVQDFTDLGLVRCYDNTVPFYVVMAGAAWSTNQRFWGTYTFTHG